MPLPLATLLLSLCLSAPASASPLSEARSLLKQGKAESAAARYAQTLRRHPKRGRRGLVRASEQAIDQLLARGASMEEADLYGEAARTYHAARALATRCREAGAPLRVEPAIQARLEQARLEGARYTGRVALVMVDEGRFESAVAFLQAAAPFGHPEVLTPVEAEVQRRWGQADLDAGDRRSGAEKLAASNRLEPSAEVARQAANTYAALGAWHLAAGHCRRAASDLRRARDLDPKAGHDPVPAEACATGSVSIRVTDLGVGQLLPRLRTGLQPAVAERVARESSDYLVVDGRTSVGARGPFEARIELADALVRREPVGRELRRKTVTGATVLYDEFTADLAIRVGATLWIEDRSTGRDVLRIPIDETIRTRYHWNHPPRAVESAGVYSRDMSRATYGSPNEQVARRLAAAAEREALDEARPAVLERMTRVFTDQILAVLDREPRAADPVD